MPIMAAEIAFDFLLGPGLFSAVIARFGKGTGGWSHVAPVLADGRYLDSRSDCIRGVPAGVHIRLPGTERAVRRQRWVLPCTTSMYMAWEDNLRARITDLYGENDILDFILGRPGHVAGHWICSAHAIDSLQHIGLLPYPLAYEAHELTPDDAQLLVSAIGFKKSDFWSEYE